MEKEINAKAFSDIVSECFAERIRQVNKFGSQDRPAEDWLMILGEEVGEANKAALEHKLAGMKTDLEYRKEMIEVATVAISAVINFDERRKKQV